MLSVIEQLILQFPDKKWNWIKLSMNPMVSFDFIKSHPEYPWIPKLVTSNLTITEEIISNNPSYQWNYLELYKHPNISFNYILNNIIKPSKNIFIDWNKLSMSAGTSLNDILQYCDKPWNDYYLSSNPNITTNYILNDGKNRNWYIPLVSANPAITEQDIYKNKLKWDTLNLSSNINLPIKYISDNINNNWNFHSISANKKTTITEINEFPNISWDFDGMSNNQNINIDYILSNPDNNWNYKNIIANNSITIQTIIDNYYELYKRGKFFPQEIEKYLCTNTTITYDWIIDNIKYIDFDKLSSNKI